MQLTIVVCRALIIGCIGALIGCGPHVPTVDKASIDPGTLSDARSLPIYDDNQLSKMQYNIINIVEGHSCQHLLWDTAATRTAAIEHVKVLALQTGANGISNVQCGDRERQSDRTNCWELISCTANAIKVTQP